MVADDQGGPLLDSAFLYMDIEGWCWEYGGTSGPQDDQLDA